MARLIYILVIIGKYIYPFDAYRWQEGSHSLSFQIPNALKQRRAVFVSKVSTV
jgi:hypothetical protein